MPFFGKPKAVIYTNPSLAPGYQTEEMRKRKEDEECALQTLCKPIEAHPSHQKQHKIDRWDFISPGPSDEEQELVAQILPKNTNASLSTRLDDRKREEVIIRAGFKDDEPATYRYFIATWGTRDEIWHVSCTWYSELAAKS
jgi:DNA-directed RNA polymerase sigma subunit (sigma70/sigma32)